MPGHIGFRRVRKRVFPQLQVITGHNKCVMRELQLERLAIGSCWDTFLHQDIFGYWMDYSFVYAQTNRIQSRAA